MESGKPPMVSSWVEIVGAAHHKHALTPFLDAETLEKLKKIIKEVHMVNFDYKLQAKQHFQHVLYGKLFGKTSGFEYVKMTLLFLWSSVGPV